MKIEKVSSGAGEKNEDLIAVYQVDGVTDIVIMDGGTSVAERDYIDSDIGDVVWFVRQFSRSLARAINPNTTQAASVLLALEDVRSAFHEKAAGISVPLYAHPIAAMTWIRIVNGINSVTLSIWCLGDCKTFLLAPNGGVLDLDPYANPQEQVLQDEIARLASQGIVDADARRAHLTPMLRARREFQNSSASPTVLCLEPRGAFNAREYTVQADRSSMLLAMTDGFYRVVDTYGLRSNEELAASCLQGGLESLLAELRDFETARADSAGRSVKSSDDASAITCLLS